MSIPTTILALYPFFMFFLQTAAAPAAKKPDSVEVGIYPAGKQVVQRILPGPPDRADAKGSPTLLREALQLLPSGAPPVDMSWLTGPMADFPVEEAKELVAGAEPAIRKLEQAVGRGPTAWDSPPPMNELSNIRNLARLVVLKARLQIAEGQFEAAAKSIGTGYALARALAGPGTELIHRLVGVAIGSLMTEQLLAMTQQPNAPSLLPAVRALPDPLIDLEPALKAEIDGLRTKVPNPLTRKVLAGQLEASHAKARERARTLAGQIAAVRVLEELRVKSAGSRQLPAKLDITAPATRPGDRITLHYKRLQAGKAELTVSTGDSEEQMRYGIELRTAGSK